MSGKKLSEYIPNKVGKVHLTFFYLTFFSVPNLVLRSLYSKIGYFMLNKNNFTLKDEK